MIEVSFLKPTSAAALAALGVAAFLLCAFGVWRFRRRRPDAANEEKISGRHADGLTGLLSRKAFERLLSAALAKAEKTGREVCVVYVGLDGFKAVNDGHGHAFGDEVLLAASEQLRSVCGNGTLLCRVAGDEFAILFNAPLETSKKFAGRLVDLFVNGMKFGGQHLSVTLSAGLAECPAHGSTTRILGRAASAMTSVKISGGAAYAVFDPDVELKQKEELAIARELRQALAKKQFELLFQPKIDASSLQVTAVEALLRWKHPKLGAVSPVKFIPIAERHGLIEGIGNWVLEAALKHAAEWRRNGLRMRVAINVSRFQMRQDDFAARVEDGLKAHKLQPNRFTCEITESVAMENTAVTRRAFSRLGKVGVHISIDDFGTGYSSLSALHRMPANELKIDRAFVTDIPHSAEARAIVKAVVQMARALNLRVVAEGVETELQRDLLVHAGCDELQGYLFAKPMTAQAITLWAHEAPKTLLQAFRPSLFKETSGPQLH